MLISRLTPAFFYGTVQHAYLGNKKEEACRFITREEEEEGKKNRQ